MNLAGYVLAGGQSTRMGRDKALLQLDGTAMVKRIAKAVEQCTGSAALIGDPDRYAGLGYPVVPDLRPNMGPLAGIEAALTHSTAEWNLVVACDMACVQSDFLASLCGVAIQLADHFDCMVPQGPDGRMQPLCAVYRSRCLPKISGALDLGNRRVTDAVLLLRPYRLTMSAQEPFQNLNSPEDWNRYLNERLN